MKRIEIKEKSTVYHCDSFPHPLFPHPFSSPIPLPPHFASSLPLPFSFPLFSSPLIATVQKRILSEKPSDGGRVRGKINVIGMEGNGVQEVLLERKKGEEGREEVCR